MKLFQKEYEAERGVLLSEQDASREGFFQRKEEAFSRTLASMASAPLNREDLLTAVAGCSSSIGGEEDLFAETQLVQDPEKVAADVMKYLDGSREDPQYRQRIGEIMSSVTVEERGKVHEILKREGYLLPSLDFRAPATEDLSTRIRTMQMGSYGAGFAQDSYLRDMLQVAAREQFVVQILSVDDETETRMWIRGDLQSLDGISEEDSARLVENHLMVIRSRKPISSDHFFEDGVLLTNGDGFDHPVRGILPAEVRYGEVVNASGAFVAFADRSSIESPSLRFLEGFHELLPSVYPRFERLQGATAKFRFNVESRDFLDAVGIEHESQGGFNEFGNTLVGTREGGAPYVLIGRDGLLMTTHHLMGQNPELFPPEQMHRVAEQLESSGVLSEGYLRSVISGLWEARKIDDEMPENQKREIAINFLSAVEITRKLLPEMYGVSPENFRVVAQPEYHLDMAIRPWRPGEVLLHDWREDITLIDRALELLDEETESERAILLSMKEYAARLQAPFEPINERIEGQLSEIGLRTTRAPGIFRGQAESGGMIDVNFLNGVPGTSLADNRQYFASNASQIRSLTKAFEEYVVSQGVTRIHWLGRGRMGERTAGEVLAGTFHAGADCLERHHDAPPR